MGPVAHTLLSTSIGVAVWKATDTPLAVPMAIVTGVLVDGDHVLDFLDWFLKGFRRHMLVLLHGWEYLIALFVVMLFWQHPLYIAAVLAYAAHVTSDHFANNTYPLAYSIIYRIYRKFKIQWLVRPPDPSIPQGEMPLWGHVEPWLWVILYKHRNKNKTRLVEMEMQEQPAEGSD